MESSDPKSASTRQASRAPIEIQVHLEFEKFSGFITEYSQNISEGGMFIQTKEPKPLGTVVSFEFKLANDFKLIQGLGEVVWVRTEDLSDDRPAGMGIKFADLDSQSRELIATMITNYVKRGGASFRLEEETPSPTSQPPAETPELTEETEAPSEAAKQVDLRKLFEITPDDVPEPESAGRSSPAGSLDGPLQSDFQALFAATPIPEPPPPPPPPPVEAKKKETPPTKEAVAKPPAGKAAPTPAKAPKPIVDLLEPEKTPPPKPKPIKRRRRIKVGVAVAVTLVFGLAPALFFRTQITRFILNVLEPEREREEPFEPKSSSPVPAATIAPTSVPTALPEATINAPAVTFPAAVTTSAPSPTQVAQSPTPAPTPGIPFSEIKNVDYERISGEFVLVIVANAPFPPGSYSTARVPEGPAREVVKILGITKPYPRQKFKVNAKDVERVRFGYHEVLGQKEFHVVMDLHDPAIRIVKIDNEGAILRVHLH
ncbi:MAG: TIGR02266 family protein [Pseudomonadota bacterium]